MTLIRKRTYLAFAIFALGFASFLLIPSSKKLPLNSYKECEAEIQNPRDKFAFAEINKAKPSAWAQESLPQSEIPFEESKLEIPIPEGAKLPAAFMDEGNPEDSEGVKELLLSLEKEFQEEYGAELHKGLTPEEAWEKARAKSDERYRTLFGQEAYLEALNVAAQEARTDWETRQ